jgi:hypothetical protein
MHATGDNTAGKARLIERSESQKTCLDTKGNGREETAPAPSDIRGKKGHPGSKAFDPGFLFGRRGAPRICGIDRQRKGGALCNCTGVFNRT